jgi:hypothetical protein
MSESDQGIIQGWRQPVGLNDIQIFFFEGYRRVFRRSTDAIPNIQLSELRFTNQI